MDEPVEDVGSPEERRIGIANRSQNKQRRMVDAGRGMLGRPARRYQGPPAAYKAQKLDCALDYGDTKLGRGDERFCCNR